MNDVPLALALSLLLGCGGDDGELPIGDACEVQPLPFTSADPESVTVLSAVLECDGESVTPLVTMRHPTPSSLDMVAQRVGVYPDRDCSGAPTEFLDTAISDQEESFGVAIDRATTPALYDEICAATEWPLRVTLGTVDRFPTTNATVAATVRSSI